MERIRLSKQEKQVLRELRRGNSNVPNGMDNYTFLDAVISLTEKRLVKSETDYNEVVEARMTAKGYAYMNANPDLLNPVDWAKIAAIASVATALATTLALFIGCSIKFG